MTALTDNRDTPMMENPITVLAEVGAAQHIYMGGLVCIKGDDGYHYPGADTVGYIFAGVAKDESNNALGADGAKEVKLYTKGRFRLVSAGATQAWVGHRVYVSDDQTVALTTTNSVTCGIVMRIESSTAVWVEIVVGEA